jgi:hypothetical protein
VRSSTSKDCDGSEIFVSICLYRSIGFESFQSGDSVAREIQLSE